MRRAEARRLVTKLHAMKHIRSDKLWEVVSSVPILNSVTVYGTYMHPSNAVLETRCATLESSTKRRVGLTCLGCQLMAMWASCRFHHLATVRSKITPSTFPPHIRTQTMRKSSCAYDLTRSTLEIFILNFSSGC